MSDIMFGLEIMLIGMGLLFMSMVLFIVVSEALKRGLKSKNDDGTSGNSAKGDLSLTRTSTILENMSEEEMAASIAAVVATYESEKEDASSKREK